MTATRYREIEVSGTPFDMGQQLGEAARDEIRGFDEIALERVNKTVSVSRERAMAVVDRCVSCVEEYSADMLAELRGVSDSSGVCLANLMLLQIRNQLQPEADAGDAVVGLDVDDVDMSADLSEGRSGGQAADTGTDDQDLHRFCHLLLN